MEHPSCHAVSGGSARLLGRPGDLFTSRRSQSPSWEPWVLGHSRGGPGSVLLPPGEGLQEYSHSWVSPLPILDLEEQGCVSLH